MIEMPPIEHHQAIVEQLDEQTKSALTEQLPKMRQIAMVKMQSVKNTPEGYDLSWIKGEIILKMLCQDGLVILVRIE